MRHRGTSLGLTIAVALGLIFLADCGSGGGGGGGTTTPTPPPPTPVANTVPVTVDAGPDSKAINSAYVSVQVCNPGSTTNCVTIDHVQVDTGTSGLRILGSFPGVSGLNLTPVTGGGVPVDECFQFPDSTYIWGPVEQADVLLAGEKASSLPIQVIDAPGSGAAVPSNCSLGSEVNRGTVAGLQANGILGIGPAPQDCGVLCAPSANGVLYYYWLCPSTGCVLASLPVATQVSNPVSFFTSDDNGVVVTLPSVGASGATSVTGGTLTFGIGSQTDNALSTATIYPIGIVLTGPYAGDYTIQSTYNTVSYPAVLDTGAFATFFLDPTTIGVSVCPGPNPKQLYCPTTAASFTVSDVGYQGTAANATINIGNAQSLLSNTSLSAFSNLARVGSSGPGNDFVEFGMPFFYGKSVYIGIAGKVTQTLGYWAF